MTLTRRQFLRNVAGVSAALPASGWCADSGIPPKIRMGTLVPKGSSYYRQLQTMGEKWRETSGGKVSLTIYPGGAMGGEIEMVRRMRQGQLQAGLLTVTGLSLIEPAVRGLQNLPMMFHDFEDVDYVGDKVHGMLGRSFEEKGFVVLFWADAGWVRFFSKTPVFTPADLKKQKLFCWTGDQDQFGLMRDIGMKPVELETADILPGLRTGLIDAVPLPPFIALASQVDTAAPHMLELNYAPLIGAAVVRKDLWERCPDALRLELLKAAEEAGRAIKLESRKDADAAVAGMQERGLQVHKPTGPQINAWRALLAEVYPKIRGKVVPEEIFDEVTRLLAERRR